KAMPLVRIVNPQHSALLLHRANQMRLSGTLCDVMIMVGHQEFHAHSLVLACTSRKFEILFKGPSKHYTLDFLSSKTFQQILDYVYTESLEAQVEDLGHLLKAAGLLEIEHLETECQKMLEALSTHKGDRGNMTSIKTTNPSGEPEETLNGKAGSDLVPQEAAWASSANEFQNLKEPTRMELEPSNPTKATSEDLKARRSPTVNGHDLGGGFAPNLDKETITPRGQLVEARPRSPVREGKGINQVSIAEANCSAFGDNFPRPSRSSVITPTTNPMHPSNGSKAVSWPTERSWSSNELLALKSNQAFLTHPSLFGYQIRDPPGAPHSSFPLLAHSHLALSTSLGFGNYYQSFPHGFLHRELGSRVNGLDRLKSTTTEGRASHSTLLMDKGQQDQHRKLQNAMKTYCCEICGKKFLDSLRLRMHQMVHSAGSKLFPCPHSGLQLSAKEDLKLHSQAHSGTDTPVFCLLGSQRFESQLALKEHIGVHAGRWSYTCSECDRAFSSHSALRRHLKSHAGEHPFECDFCGRCFRDEFRIQSSISIQVEGKRVQIRVTLHRFWMDCQLTVLPAGAKPFECKLCHQRSRDYSAMIKHLRTHKGASPYQCTICLEFCSSLSAMQKHVKSHKPEEIPPDWTIEKTYLYSCST
uniref:Zinc finger and BTB domain containing 16 n=1 Tax=Latimeria chalumnae TaxID=7897 RepID=H2ZX66_LATCH